jgi:hypothetical protein
MLFNDNYLSSYPGVLFGERFMVAGHNAFWRNAIRYKERNWRENLRW